MLQSSEIAVFKKDKLVGWLNQDESKGFNYIMGNVQSTVGRVPCPNGGELVIEIMSANGDIVPSYENGKPTFTIKTEINVNVAEVICEIDLKDPDTIKELEKNIEERQKKLLELVVSVAQEQYKSDIFGFGSTFRKKYPRVWKKIKEDWDEQFPTVEVKYEPNVTVNLTGTMNESITIN